MEVVRTCLNNKKCYKLSAIYENFFHTLAHNENCIFKCGLLRHFSSKFQMKVTFIDLRKLKKRWLNEINKYFESFYNLYVFKLRFKKYYKKRRDVCS